MSGLLALSGFRFVNLVLTLVGKISKLYILHLYLKLVESVVILGRL